MIPDGQRTRVNAGAKLTIEPGVVVKFGWNSFLNTYGVIEAAGSAAEPIIFTSLFDDSAAGDTNGDGDLTEPSQFDWWGANFNAGSGPHLIEHAKVRYSDSGLFFYRTSAVLRDLEFSLSEGGLGAGESDMTIERLNLHDLVDDGIWGSAGSFVISSSTFQDIFFGDVMSFYSGARVEITGSNISGVGFGSALGLYGSHATATASHFANGLDSGVELYRDFSFGGSSLYLTDSVVESFPSFGLAVFGSVARVERTALQDNGYGAQIGSTFEFKPHVSISGGSVLGNFFYGVMNSTTTPVDARENFWGDASGPFHALLNPDGLGDEVSDNVDFSGWLSSDPLAEAECCSSVVFLPGLEASRLYKPGAIFENQLWEPNTNDDVRALALDPITGESVNADIYTDDVIDEAFSVNIYKNFLSFMENMVGVGDIADFETFPYDWRLDVRDVVGRAVALRGGSYEMIPRLRALAVASQTGKVTLVAHSNGGLVAKELLNALKNSGEENLVDKLILVATPELGTPKAVLEMLHGMEPFAFNFPREEVTRELAENMKSAYALLPSAEYFNQLGVGARPVIEFSTTTDVTSPFREIYGETISSYGDLRQFILGDNGARPEPPAAAVNLPNVLKGPFLAQAETRYTELDFWQPPAGVDVVRIIGWGLETPRGIVYESATQNVCNADLSVCFEQEVLDPEPLSTVEGDGTVVYLSADALGGERYYVNMFDYNEQQNTIDRDHKNILEIEPLRNLISTLVKNEATTTLPAFTFTEKPDKVSAAERLRIDVHSPVALHLYDSLGRHTGPIPNPDLSSDLELFEEQIPNSYYWQLGEGQYAGASGATTTTIRLVGTALGSATVGIEKIVSDETIIFHTLFEDIPITTGGTATVDVIPDTEPILLLDVDGDGVVDAEITPDGLSPDDLIAILKSLIKTLDLPDKKEKQLLKVIDKLEKEFAKEHKKEKTEKLKTKQAFKHLLKLIEQYQKKKVLSADEANELLGLIEDIMNKVVK